MPPERESRPVGNVPAQSISVAAKTMPTVPDQRPDVRGLLDHLDHVQRRVVQEAMATASSSFWLRRAADFRGALPRQDEWHGREGLASVRVRCDRLKAIITACEHAAEVALWQDGEPDGV